MLLQTNPTLNQVLKRWLTLPDESRPLLILGRPGTSRYTHLMAYIRQQAGLTTKGCVYRPYDSTDPFLTECSCNTCERIKRGKASDILTLTGGEGAAELREVLHEFRTHLPVELPYRHLIVRNAHRFTKDHLDTLLKLLEEPPSYLKLYLTAAAADKLPPAILSRCTALQQPGWTPEHWATMIAAHPALMPYAKAKQAYDFRSFRDLQLYLRFSWEDRYKDLWVNFTDPGPLEYAINTLHGRFEADAPDLGLTVGELWETFLQFGLDRHRAFLMANAAVNPKLGVYAAHWYQLGKYWEPALFQYITNRYSPLYMNLQQQIQSFFLNQLLLRKICQW